MAPAGEHTESQLGAPEDAIPEQIVAHVDCDCFYAACERRREPALRETPVVVGMGYDPSDPGGAVATASYDARDRGVEAAMPINQARDCLPRMADADAADPDAPDPEACGYYRPVDMAYYERIGEQLRKLLDEHADVVEPISIDEAYLDVTDSISWARARQFAESLQQTITEKLSLPVSIGIAPTKSGAKIAADYDKPEGTTVVKPQTLTEFLGSLPVDTLPGVGPVTGTELSDRGIETIGDLATADPAALSDQFGQRGRMLYRRARGIDSRPVTPPDDPKSLSKEQSFSDPLTDTEAKQRALSSLVEAVTERARDRNVLYRTVGIKVISPPYEVQTRAQTLPGPIADQAVVDETAAALLREFTETPIRKLGVRLGNLTVTETRQPTLAAWSDTPTDSPSVEFAPADRQATLKEFYSRRSS